MNGKLTPFCDSGVSISHLAEAAKQNLSQPKKVAKINQIYQKSLVGEMDQISVGKPIAGRGELTLEQLKEMSVEQKIAGLDALDWRSQVLEIKKKI